MTHDTLHITVPQVRFRHNGLRRLHERGDAQGLDSTRVAPSGVCSTTWKPRGNRQTWSVRVSDNWRIVFRFEDGEAVDVDLVDYH